MPDISIKEFRAGVLALRTEIGPRAEIYTSVNDKGPTYCANVYCKGLTQSRGEMEFRVEANTFRDLLAGLQGKWSEHSDVHAQRTVRKMALAIIRITAELGECTDAALRNCGEFDPGQVRRFGAAACADANEIAGKGPFSIVVMGSANSEAA